MYAGGIIQYKTADVSLEYLGDGEFRLNLKKCFQTKTSLYKNGDTFPIEKYESVLQYVKDRWSKTYMQHIPPHVLSFEENNPMRHQTECKMKYSNQLHTSLKPFQREGVKTIIQNFDGHCFLADQMGLGKTIQAIACIQHYYNNEPHKRVLIICPSYLRFNWLNEITQWGGGMCSVDIVPNGKTLSESTITITSYDLAVAQVDQLKKNKYSIIVVDESHYLKSKNTKRVKKLMPLLKKSGRVLLLSGTPITNKPVELFTQLNIICPTMAGKYQQFVNRYCDAKKFCGHYDVNGASCMQELHWIMKSLCVRRLKADVLHDLPDKTRTQIQMEIASKEKKSLKTLFTRWQTLNKTIPAMLDGCKEQREAVFERKKIINELYHTSAEAKMDKIKQVVNDLIMDGEKVIIFAHHHVMLDALEEMVKNSDLQDENYVRVDGKTPAKLKNFSVNYFQENEKCKIAILSILACGTGLTLTASSRIVFVEMYWVTSVMLQAEDRIHRIGQKNCCDIRYIIANGTLDPYLWKMLNKKMDIVCSIMDGETNASLGGDTVVMDKDPMDELSDIFEQEFSKKKKRKKQK